MRLLPNAGEVFAVDGEPQHIIPPWLSNPWLVRLGYMVGSLNRIGDEFDDVEFFW